MTGAEKVKKLIHHMNELEHAWQNVLDSYDEAAEDFPELHDKFAESYPFEKSFDDYILPLYDWRASVEELLHNIED